MTYIECNKGRKMTRAEKLKLVWRKTHRDYKGLIKGERYVLVLRTGGTQLVPLTDLTDEEIEQKGGK